MTSPFIFDVADLLRSGDVPEQRVQTGPAPTRIGVEMIAIPEGAEVTVSATLTPLGDAVMADADVSAALEGECVRCLETMTPPATFHVSGVFSDSPDFVTSAEDEDEDEGENGLLSVENGTIDLLQLVIDEAGLSLPFNPQCEGGCVAEDSENAVPEPDGVSGEDEKNLPDPRWAGLEKFL
ncbi:YceD family protein [Corynebacterium uropygiale]|uniref:YceD family protein n=1 Tax=Corynebacterium uropygiale TaxID=1775911 RepID=A0A9X1QRC2_9CORY|nr:YceD family protein [Corynebacterium uropygiale]MCF4006343.1 YceD family protein [Corynebacterium uropygiale]